jgi:hypothetical protein
MAHSPVSPPSPGPASHPQEAPTLDYPTLSSTLPRKRQRIYQSLSSAFSKNKSPRAPSPEPLPAGFLEATSSSEVQEPIPGAEDKMQSIGWINSEPSGDSSDQEENNQSLRWEPVITKETVAIQPQSELGSLLRAADRQLGAAEGLFAPLPTIAEVTLAHEDLQQILKPLRCSGRGYKDPEFDHLFRIVLKG